MIYDPWAFVSQESSSNKTSLSFFFIKKKKQIYTDLSGRNFTCCKIEPIEKYLI